MKYKYEFEVDEDFEKGYCYDCPFSYIGDWNDFDSLSDLYCSIGKIADDDGYDSICPLIEVEE